MSGLGLLRRMAILVALGVCVSCSSYDAKTTVGASTGASPAEKILAQDCSLLQPWAHLLQIDRRGEYDPVPFDLPEGIDCKGRRAFAQIGHSTNRPGSPDWAVIAPELIAKTVSCTRLTSDMTMDDFLDCQLDLMLAQLDSTVAANPKITTLLYIHIHGGLNDAKARTSRAVRDIPMMALDCAHEVTAKLTCVPRDQQRNHEVYFPIYIAWPSGGLDTYGDSIANYGQGRWDSFKGGWPFRLLSDLGSVIVNAPLTYVKSVRRALEGENQPAALDAEGAEFNTFGCPRDGDTHDARLPHYECELTQQDQPDGSLATATYLATFPIRAVTTPFVDPLGKTAWDSMIARTRFAFRKPGPAWRGGDMARPARTEGVVVRLFEKLRKRKLEGRGVHLRLTGHSMGAIVASEIVRLFPDLDYDAVTFMGAAVSIREFRNSVVPYLRRLNGAGGCIQHPRFFNLSLHPSAEMEERFAGGLTLSGSLLEWIDDMYEKPGDLVDRTLGRWRNVVSVRDVLAEASPCAYLKRFGQNWRSPTTHGAFDDIRTCTLRAANGNEKKLFIRPFYWEYAFWKVSSSYDRRKESTPGLVRVSTRSGDPPDAWQDWRFPTAGERPTADSVCIDDLSGAKLVRSVG